jgi:hypothetical protein
MPVILSLSKNARRGSPAMLRQAQHDPLLIFPLALVCNERLIWFGDCIARCVINANPCCALVTNEREINDMIFLTLTHCLLPLNIRQQAGKNTYQR